MPLHLTDPKVDVARNLEDGQPIALPQVADGPQSALTESQKQAVTAVIAGFYRELAGKWRTTVLVDIWQGPNAVMVGQLSADPMGAGVAKSLISMLDTILAAKPETDTLALRQTGALQALYGIAFGATQRLDLLPYASLPVTALNPDEAQAWVRCCLCGEALHALKEPVVVRTQEGVHLFEFSALKQFFREGFKFINPMNRRPIVKDQLMRLVPSQAAVSPTGPDAL